MKTFLIAASAAAVVTPVALPTVANAQSRQVRQEQRECNRELRRADNRREYNRELRECRREVNKAQRQTARDWRRYRNYDLLLIDDIQFFEGKERIQEEFFHTFNSLYEAGRQIVISSDRPPKEIATLEDRLRSRFEWGLIADIQPPDFETRVAILKKKAALERVRLADDVAYLIASRVKSNIRELEGSLTRMIAFCALTGREMSTDLAQEVLADLWGEEEKVITIEQIQRKVSDIFGIKLSDLKAKNRTKAVAFPRQVAMYLSRQLTHASLSEIGRAFGGKDPCS